MLTINNRLFPKSDHDSLLILSDLEPDDVLALFVLLKQVSKTFPILFVTGEGNLDKTGMATQLLNHLGSTNFKVIQGPYNEHKEYPKDAISVFGEAKKSSACDVKYEIEYFLEQFSTPLVLGIKPFTELFNVKPQLLGKCVLALYGGFNLRCMSFAVPKETVAHFVNTSFKHVILYESFFATGEQNSINKQNAAKMFETIMNSSDPVLIGLVNLIKIWNDYIAYDCLDTVTSVSKKMRDDWPNRQWDELTKQFDQIYNRNMKVIKSITESQSLQMVLADFGLTALLITDDIKQGETTICDIGFTPFGYTEVKPNTLGKVYAIQSVGFDNMVSIITSKL